MSHSLEGEGANGVARDELKSHASDVASDFAELRKDVAKLAAAVGKVAKAQASQTGSQVGELGRDLQGRASEGMTQVGERVRERPLAAVGVSLGAGLLLGLIMSARRGL